MLKAHMQIGRSLHVHLLSSILLPLSERSIYSICFIALIHRRTG